MSENTIPCRDEDKSAFRRLKRAKSHLEDRDYTDTELLRELVDHEEARLEIRGELAELVDQ